MPKKSKYIYLLIVFNFAAITMISGQEISVQVTPVKCFGDKSGSVKLLLSKGIAPYIYILSKDSLHKSEIKRSPISNDLNFLFSGVAAGNYFVTAICGDGGVSIKSLNIEQPAQLLPGLISIEAHPSSSSSKNGILIANPKGGNPPYSFSWQGIGVKGTESKISGLGMGIYKCSITDSNGCGPVSSTAVLKTTS
jgi:hypothetical protein